MILFKFFTQVIEESLLIDKEQDKTEYSYKYLVGIWKKKLFVSKKIIINEGIIYNRVIYYMGIIENSKEDEKIYPLFCKLWPRIDCLKCVYTFIQKFDQTKL